MFSLFMYYSIWYYLLQYSVSISRYYKIRKKINSGLYFFLSTTIQASVGMSDIYPITNIGKIFMILQQLIMIMTHVFTIYVFNL